MTARIGLLGRMDDGGLGTMTWEFARHIHPERVLIVDLGHEGRGKGHIERYTDNCNEVGVSTSWPGFDAEAANWLLRDIDILYTAETFYWPEIQAMCTQRGIRTVLHSMPELHAPGLAADQIWVPTTWEQERIPGARYIPVPVALDRFESRQSERAEAFLHIVAPAMLDRNGTDALLGALPLINEPCEIRFRGLDLELTNPSSPAAPRNLGGKENYWEMTEDGDVLLMPRRYGGLSLPMQEAMARGMPIITTDLLPQKEWGGVLAVPVTSPRPVQMKGGVFHVWDVAHNSLAAAIENLVRNPGTFRKLSEEARRHAGSISWDRMGPIYRAEFEDLLA